MSALESRQSVLIELLALERELRELIYVRRSDALERASDAARRLGELPSSERILARATAGLGAASELDRVLISEIVDGQLVPLTIWAGDQQARAEAALAQLTGVEIRLEYPLLEHDVARSHVAQVVSVAAAGARTPQPLCRVLGWHAYAVGALTVAGETIGLLHADSQAGVDGLAGEVVGRYAEELSGVLERAVLRHTLALHRAQLAGAVDWMGVRLSRLEDDGGLARPPLPAGAEAELAQLTPRELDVLRLLARGSTNLQIAAALVVREGTVKYHVKNILRKLGATSRADAVGRFVRAADAGGGPQ
ncbi:MAG: helix-turn-helix transcriptional regulator [Solirubrobacteraceae bacterium]